MRKESKQNDEESHQTTREEREKKETGGTIKTDSKHKQNVSNYFKCKWTKLSSKKI